MQTSLANERAPKEVKTKASAARGTASWSNGRESSSKDGIPGGETPWRLTTLAWSILAFLLPPISVLPAAIRGVWFIGLGALIATPIVFRMAARPVFPAIWVFAGYSSLVAMLLSTDDATVSENLFVGSQLFLLLGLSVFILTYNALTDPCFVKRVGMAFLAGQSVSGFVAFMQAGGYTAIALERGAKSRFYGRFPGLAEHPNTLGMLSAVAILLAAGALAKCRGRNRFLAAMAMMANVGGILASGSISGLVAAAAGLLVMLVASDQKNMTKLILGAGLTALLGLGAAYGGAIGRLPSLTKRIDEVRELTWKARTRTFDFALEKLGRDPIFGNGLHIRASETVSGSDVLQVHNAVLRAWFQGGVMLALAFIFIACASLVLLVNAIRDKECGTEAGILMAAAVYASVSPLLEQRSFWLPVAFAWSSISAYRLRRREESRVHPLRPNECGESGHGLHMSRVIGSSFPGLGRGFSVCWASSCGRG